MHTKVDEDDAIDNIQFKEIFYDRHDDNKSEEENNFD